MFGQAPRGGVEAVAYPQQSTTVMGPSEKWRNFPTLSVFEFLEIPNAYHKRVAMRLPIDRQSNPLPKRFPIGARYVVEGRGGEDGHLRVISRYIVLPGGQRINVPSDLSKFGATFGAMSVHAPRGKRGQARTSRTAAKKICGAPEPPGNSGIDHRRRAKPPSPSPSITRRRTPAVLAAGVPLFGPFILHCPFQTALPWPRGTEARVRCFRHVGVMSVAFARVCGVGCADSSFGMAPGPSFLIA